MAKTKSSSENTKSESEQSDTNEQYRSKGSILHYYYYRSKKSSKPICDDSLLDSIRKQSITQNNEK